MTEPGRWPAPGAELVSARELMDRHWAAETAKVSGLGPSWFSQTEGQVFAQWLAGQLPGSDPERTGWGLIAVAAMLYPGWYDPGLDDILRPAGWPPGRGKGASMGLLLASRVGEALIGMGNLPPAVPAVLAVGGELAGIDFMELLAESGLDPDLLSDSRADVEELTEIRRFLMADLPGADLRATGWAAAASAVLVATQLAGFPAPGRFGRRARWRAGVLAGTAAAAVALGMTGQALAREPARPGRM
jgi:hypothetical protein